MSVSTDDVKKLAELSRLALTEGEVEKLRSEIESILAYVAVVQKVDLPPGIAASPHLDLQNVMREDGEPHAGSIYSEDMLSQAPARDGNFLKVKKILG
ncbi:MAG: Asp-tRNA(Asn)/Glu-tRNA(Gln) amidotransferase subunit GatC [Patescibacteria group bacterium]|mgnify:CR=1 FL=1